MFPKLFFVALLLAGVAFYWWRRRTLPPALILFIASVFLSRVYWEFAGSTIRLEQVMALLLFAYFLLNLLRRKIAFRLQWPAILVLALFPLMLLSSLLVSPEPWQSLKKSLVYLPYFLAFLAMVHYLSSAEKLREAWRAFYVFGAAAVSLSVIGFYLLYFGINAGMVRVEYDSMWLRGTIVAPNIMGSTAVIIFLAALGRLTGKNPGQKKRRMMHMAVLAVSFAAAMMSYSRGAWAGVLLAMMVVAGWRGKELALKSTAAVLLLVLGSCVFVYFTTTENKWLKIEKKSDISLGEFGEAKMDEFFNPNSNSMKMEAMSINYKKKINGLLGNERSDKWRFNVLKLALKDWLLSPILGRGTDSLQLMSKEKLPKNIYIFFIPITSVAILHDWGMTGLLLYCAFLLSAFLGLLKIYCSKIEAKLRELMLVLLLVLVLSTLMYQISTTMQLSIFWCLFAFYAAAISLNSWPVAGTSPE